MLAFVRIALKRRYAFVDVALPILTVGPLAAIGTPTDIFPEIRIPVAKITGMTLMALGLGDGGEQNAPFSRAVIAGLILATFVALIFVPVVFSVIHRKHGTVPLEAPGAHGVPYVA